MESKEMLKKETLEMITWCWNKSTLAVFHDWVSVPKTQNSESQKERKRASL